MPQFEEEAASGRFFFRKQNRVLKRSDFQKIYNQGRPWRRPLVHVFILPPATDDAVSDNVSLAEPGMDRIAPTRLGITATKKVGNAVRRNRARRLVRESYRLMLPELRPGYSIVVNVMRAAATAPYASVDAQLRDIFKKAGIFKSPENKVFADGSDTGARQ